MNMAPGPVVEEQQLLAIVEQARARGARIVWTNGCFDLLHAGHVRYLRQAKALGDLLIVGLNSDRSVALWKNPDRPFVPQEYRLEVLAAIRYVDYVVLFDERSPLRLLELLKPDVYVKGGDYTIDTIDQDERRLVEAYGGAIVIMPKVGGLSTTDLARRVTEVMNRTSPRST
ncbi:MAG: adenylyltransferase/cytidyltransferase family protein [candidate division KSB1 bacterium]|nr:adenylyltransferase/cytidyltransferase family protein [candidate division KSB1 bacterium]MDZ7379049.1 adenylyltransferase/cytidyltransferase family protein [candidate division KSB1 bacterium]MDZ7385754.1 adenylyltransferase/cytidyltransferase family protein [candidate division KSB1 bacterium]MDZ7391345.1 adenylyltransferase/cytidyltransferase family protein [candidate division KSB1 bacterium]MDZ7414334.1 adenylyltransferase/cytidyltransferase family protein [candidate division KSB1 bacterium